MTGVIYPSGGEAGNPFDDNDNLIEYVGFWEDHLKQEARQKQRGSRVAAIIDRIRRVLGNSDQS